MIFAASAAGMRAMILFHYLLVDVNARADDDCQAGR